jgi:DHA1 family inner membrane transport protein
MAYFRNNTVNLLNLHYGIHSIALSGTGAFWLVYMLKAGVPVAGVLGALALIVTGRFIIRPIVIPIGVRIGIRNTLILGTFLTALQYPLVARVHGMGWPLLELCLMGAISDSIYWTSYHAYFATLGDHDDRGSQVGVREAIAAVVGIVAPVAASAALVAFGAQVAFGATALVIFCAAVPLLFMPNVAVVAKAPGAIRAASTGVLLFLSDGWICAGYFFAFQIALFITLDQNFLAYGGALAVAAFAGAIGGMLLGRYIDAGHGMRAVWLAFGGLLLATLFRAAAAGHPALAVICNALGSLEACLYIPTIMTPIYNLAKKSPCPLRFHMVSEGGWDVGCAAGCLLVAFLSWLGVSLSISILTSLAGGTLAFTVLRRYYVANPSVAPTIDVLDIPAIQTPHV